MTTVVPSAATLFKAVWTALLEQFVALMTWACAFGPQSATKSKTANSHFVIRIIA
jgi:hypothetical protein